jgi:CheY-like chemotaxis protein
MPTVAIIDDEPLLVDMLTTFLKIKGFRVCSADSGEDGLTLVRIEKPDLLLLDLMLPDIDGFKVCQQLRATPDFAQMPILIVSARAESASMAHAETVGATGYMTKPVKLPMLLEEVQRLTQPKPELAPTPVVPEVKIPEVPAAPPTPPVAEVQAPEVPTAPPIPPVAEVKTPETPAAPPIPPVAEVKTLEAPATLPVTEVKTPEASAAPPTPPVAEVKAPETPVMDPKK